jgi:SHS2 domain-containing protein
MDAPELSVYGEAKGEYTRQLSVLLVPVLEQYFIDLLAESKTTAPSPQKILWTFQVALQNIPDWNQDKVLRETEKIQKDTKCDYLEELLTAVFIAHTKVLSAIRLTTKQKKLQITIPKLDHFLHRVLSESARSLWTNVFLFADTNSIEKQKNLRQVSALLQESVLQAIRGMLPVKSILREYLHEDDDDEDVESSPSKQTSESVEPLEKEKEKSESSEPVAEVAAPSAEPEVAESNMSTDLESESKQEESEQPVEEEKIEPPTPIAPPTPTSTPTLTSEPPAQIPTELSQPSESTQQMPQTIVIDTKPSVSFSQEHVFFDSNTLEENSIQDIPFAEAELRPPEEDEEDEDDEEHEEIIITDEILPMEADEILE